MREQGEIVTALLAALLDGESYGCNAAWRLAPHPRYSVAGWMIFSAPSAARQYGLGNSSLATGLWWSRRHFTRRLFPEVLLAEPNTAGETASG